MRLDRLAWRTVASRPLRSLLTIVGIALGVGVLSASLTIGAALDVAVDRTVRDMVGRADIRISGFAENGLSDAALAVIRATPGVTAAAEVVERRTFLEGKPNGGAASAVTVLGIDPASYADLHDLPLASGQPLAGADEPVALVSETLAAQDGYQLGSQLSMFGAGGTTAVRVVGLLPGLGPIAGNGRTVVIPLGVARTAFGVTSASRVDLRVVDGGVGSVLNALAATMTEPYIVAQPADIARTLRASSANFQGMAALIAAVILFVGAFLIVNTLQMTVGERAREVGLLRAAGATRGQISRFVFSGALLLGVTGSLLGVALGAGLAFLMAGAVSQATGLTAAIDGFDVSGALAGAAVGIGVSVLAAIEPALNAAQISPVEALRARFDIPDVRRARLSWIAFIFLVVAAIAMIAWPPAVASSGADRAFAVYGVLLAATLASPFLLRPLARLLGMPVMLILRLEERLARISLGRDRSRTALTLGSLVIGLAMIVALAWSAQAARAAAFAWLEDVVPGDEIVTSIRPIAADEGVQDALASVEGVARVTPIASFDLAFRGLRIDAAAVVGADLLADGRLTPVQGDRATALQALDAGGATILPSALAKRLGLAVGDTMHVPVDSTHAVDLRVAAIVDRSLPGSSGEAMLVGWADATEKLGVKGADAYAIRFAADAPAGARTELSQTASTYALEANPIEKVQSAVADALARVFGVFDALAVVAVIVAALGIVNTLTMGVVERIREIGILRAIGMSRRQAMRMVVVEAAILGIVGVVLGSLAGIAAGALLLFFGTGLGPSVGVPTLPIAIAAGLGLVLPAIAALYPARVASRVSIVEALDFE